MSITLKVAYSTPFKLWDACQGKLQRQIVLGDMVNYDDFFFFLSFLFQHRTEFIDFSYVLEKKQTHEVKVEQSIP